MITKAELTRKFKEQERQLQLIYKYKPSFQFIEQNEAILQKMGMREDQIREVFTKGSTSLVNRITNPQNGEEIAIYIEEVSIRKNKSAEGYGVFVGKAPYREFFDQQLMTTAKLEELSKDFPEVKSLFNENQKMKVALSLLGK